MRRRRKIRPTASPWKTYVVDAPRKYITAQPVVHEVIIERGLRIPMRDGTELAAIFWRPRRKGRYPALIERGPHRPEERTGPAGEYYAARGYAVLSVGLRGCSGSEGEFLGPVPGAPIGDGYDTVEWAAIQPWCNGRVGMLCGSISGFTQYQTVVEAPPHLESLLVREGLFGAEMASGGVVPLLALQFVATSWTECQLEHYPPKLRSKAQRLVRRWQQDWQNARQAAEPDSPLLSVPDMLKRLPLYPNPLFTGAADYYNDWLVPPEKAGWGRSADLESRADQVQIPVCHLGGWFDGTLPHTLAAFVAMQARARTPRARKAQRLIVGPWVHGPMSTHGKPVGLLEFGPNAKLDFFAFRQRWYDAHLRRKGAVSSDPVVWLYLTGPDRWLGFETWPPRTASTTWYLHPNALTKAAPNTAQNPDAYEYDPDDPVPTLEGGGAMGIGIDQRPIEHRLLTYTSSPLKQPLTLLGPLKTVLHAASSAPDTDWVVRLTMVRPDGASVILSGGTLRARYRRSLKRAVLLDPDRPERFEIDMMPLSMVVPAGHCLRLTVTSSDFPAIDRNLNTGGPVGRQRQGKTAIIIVYHDRLRPSGVVLPVLERSSDEP